jgi:hypothetical protein
VGWFCTRQVQNVASALRSCTKHCGIILTLPLCEIIAGLHSVALQQLGPDTAHSNLEALSTLKHLRNLDTP